MAFVTAKGLTEEHTSRTAIVDGTTVRYHDVGEGDPIIFLHTYGPGCNSWITWYRVLDRFAASHRCILMDLAGYGGTGPITYNEPIHYVHARLARGLMDELGLDTAHVVGNSQGGQTAFIFAYRYPERVRKLVWGAGHVGGKHGEYLLGVEPAQGIQQAMIADAEPTVENFRRHLEVALWDQSLVTDELVEYVRTTHLSNPEIRAAAKASPYIPHVHSDGLVSITVPSLLIWGRNDRTCGIEIGINALNLSADPRLVILKDTGHWAPFERPDEYAGHVLAFLAGYGDNSTPTGG